MSDEKMDKLEHLVKNALFITPMNGGTHELVVNDESRFWVEVEGPTQDGPKTVILDFETLDQLEFFLNSLNDSVKKLKDMRDDTGNADTPRDDTSK